LVWIGESDNFIFVINDGNIDHTLHPGDILGQTGQGLNVAFKQRQAGLLGVCQDGFNSFGRNATRPVFFLGSYEQVKEDGHHPPDEQARKPTGFVNPFGFVTRLHVSFPQGLGSMCVKILNGVLESRDMSPPKALTGNHANVFQSFKCE
jgi:hypothetical protein